MIDTRNYSKTRAKNTGMTILQHLELAKQNEANQRKENCGFANLYDALVVDHFKYSRVASLSNSQQAAIKRYPIALKRQMKLNPYI